MEHRKAFARLLTKSQSQSSPLSCNLRFEGLRNIQTYFTTTKVSSPDSSIPSHVTTKTPRLPRAVQVAYLRPLKRAASHGVPVCDLQLRSYNARNLDLMTDFALRAAYYLGIPASGPVPLPRLVERWTVSKSNFIHKKTQENFERRTLRRLIQLKDANVDSVQIWLAFLRKNAYYGVGMKANIWQNETLGVGKGLDQSLESLHDTVDRTWAHFGRRAEPHDAGEIMKLIS